MKTQNKLLITSMLLSMSWIGMKGQNTFPTGAGTSVGIGTNAPATRFQVVGGESRFGSAVNYGQHAADGDLTFTGNADYLVGGNRYAFRFAGDPDFGLFFNQTNLRYEFRDAAAIPVFFATTAGDGFFAKGVQIGNSILNNAGNIKWTGTDFEGFDGVNWKSFTAVGIASETDPQVGINTTNFLSKWNGSALVSSNVFDNATNVGIGTSSPAQKLDVVGNIQASGSVTATGGNSGNWNTAFGWGDHGVEGYLTSESDPQVGINTTSKVPRWDGSTLSTGTIFDNGTNVGIGTSTPAARLAVANTNLSLGGTGSIQIGETNTTNLVFDNNEIMARTNGVASLLSMNIDGGASFFGGNVGIGNSIPTVKLNVDGGADATLAGGGYIVAGPVAGTNVRIDNDEIMATANGLASTLSLNFDGGNVVNCVNGGNVGVGISAPAFKLDVFGDIKTSGTLRMGTSGRLFSTTSFTISSNSNLDHETDNLDGLGTSAKRWVDVWAVDGTINTSDIREKSNIKDLTYGIEDVMKLRPVSYIWTKNPERGTKLGLIAQDLQKVIPEVVRDWERKADEVTGERKIVPSTRLGVMYDDIIPVIISGVQDQQLTIETNTKELDALKKEVAMLKEMIAQANLSETNNSSNNEIADGSTSANNERAVLEQNAPNPFKDKTTISYYIPENVKSAVVKIYSLNGDAMKTIQVNGTGKGFVEVNGGSFAAGTYTYQLILDDKTIDTKLMVITK
jgi:Chaperone of endosialidase